MTNSPHTFPITAKFMTAQGERTVRRNAETGVEIWSGERGLGDRVMVPSRYSETGMAMVMNTGRNLAKALVEAKGQAADMAAMVAAAFVAAAEVVDQDRWTHGAIVDMEVEAYAEDARRSGLVTGTAWIRPPAAPVPQRRVQCMCEQPGVPCPKHPETRTDDDALRDTANHHQGTRVHAADDQHQRDMRRRGLVGPRGGLTRKGSIAAERLRGDALDAAFGLL